MNGADGLYAPRQWKLPQKLNVQLAIHISKQVHDWVGSAGLMLVTCHIDILISLMSGKEWSRGFLLHSIQVTTYNQLEKRHGQLMIITYYLVVFNAWYHRVHDTECACPSNTGTEQAKTEDKHTWGPKYNNIHQYFQPRAESLYAVTWDTAFCDIHVRDLSNNLLSISLEFWHCLLHGHDFICNVFISALHWLTWMWSCTHACMQENQRAVASLQSSWDRSHTTQRNPWFAASVKFIHSNASQTCSGPPFCLSFAALSHEEQTSPWTRCPECDTPDMKETCCGLCMA